MLSILFCSILAVFLRNVSESARKRYSEKGGIAYTPYPLGTPRKEVGCGYRI